MNSGELHDACLRAAKEILRKYSMLDVIYKCEPTPYEIASVIAGEFDPKPEKE